MEMLRWWLKDASETQRSYPYTFYRPSQNIIGKLVPGNLVKLIFEFDNPDPQGYSAERMWVKITHIDGNRFKGELDNQPAELTSLKPGDPVEFEARHVISTDIEDNEPSLVEQYVKRCFVTRRVLYDGEPAGFLYREEPDQDNDSGWRITAGDESDEYMDNEDNIFYVSLGAVLNEDDSFVHLLDSGIGSAFERNAQTGQFEPEEP